MRTRSGYEYPLLPNLEESPVGPLALEIISWRFLLSMTAEEPSMLSLSQMTGALPSSSCGSLAFCFCFLLCESTRLSERPA